MFEKGARSTRRNFVKGVGVTAATTVLLGQTALSAHAASFQDTEQNHISGAGINVLLVHGAFEDASSWSKVIPLLQDVGFHVLAVQLPLSSLEDDVNTARQALATLSGPTILAGHSYGGAVINNVGTNAANVISLVYVAAFAPAEGESVNTLTGLTQFSPPLLASHIALAYPKGFIWVDLAFFPEVMVQDIPKEQANVLTAIQKPIAAVSFAGVSGVPAWKQHPSWFLVSKNDRAINPDLERFMARRIGATTREVASSHSSPVSHPIEVFQIILAASQAAH